MTVPHSAANPAFQTGFPDTNWQAKSNASRLKAPFHQSDDEPAGGFADEDVLADPPVLPPVAYYNAESGKSQDRIRKNEVSSCYSTAILKLI